MPTFRLCLLTASLLFSTASLAQNLTPQLKINGYATAGIAWLDEDSGGYGKTAAGAPAYYNGASYMQNSYGRVGVNEDINTKFDSVLGLQLDYQVNDKTNLVTQLVAKGQNQDSFKIQADWVYIRYAFNENWVGRAGRLGFPGFMYSDSMLIGHSFPWVRPPAEVYANTPVPSVQGADISYRYNFSKWTLGAQLTGGNADTSDARLTTQNLAALYFTASTDNLTLRAGGLHFNLVNNVSLAPLPDLDSGKSGRFGSAGVLYDNNQWLFAGEFVQQRVAGWPADFDAGYITVGHYVGKFLPYAGWAKITTLGDEGKTVTGVAPAAGALVNTRPSSIFEQTSYTLGLRFDPKPGLSLKAQVEHITDMGQYNGMFRFSSTGASTAPVPGTSALVGAATLPELKSANLFSLTANVAF